MLKYTIHEARVSTRSFRSGETLSSRMLSLASVPSPAFLARHPIESRRRSHTGHTQVKGLRWRVACFAAESGHLIGRVQHKFASVLQGCLTGICYLSISWCEGLQSKYSRPFELHDEMDRVSFRVFYRLEIL